MHIEPQTAPFVVRSAWCWRRLHRLLPLGQRYNPLIRLFVGRHLLLQVPWGPFSLVISGDWLGLDSSASAPIYNEPHDQNAEFFSILGHLFDTLPTGAILDVGANIGTYTLNVRASCHAPIIAFEPDPFLFTLLQHNVRLNQLSSVSLKNLACGDVAGRLAFQTGINGNVIPAGQRIAGTPGEPRPDTQLATSGPAQSDGVISVQVVRLDDELASVGPIGLIKIDCEGFEFNILKGAWRTIQRDRPVLFVELHPKLIRSFDYTVTDVCNLLHPLYDLQFWDIGSRQRSSSRLRRFLGRYDCNPSRLTGKSELLAVSERDPKPDQLFLLGLAK